jgi:hypothetical protein
MQPPYSCTPVLTGRASRAAHPPVPTVTDIGPGSARRGGRWCPSMSGSGSDAQRGKLIETDLNQPYLDGVTAPIDRG